MTAIRLEQVSKRYVDTVALSPTDLVVQDGELFFLLGPSGCGKSTLLRLIAGLQPPSSGRIFFDNRDVTEVPTQERNAVMCFQGYALWPHMTVREHIAFGLSVRKMPLALQAKRVDEMLALIQMEGELGSRKPSQLSGGQQQRVALARALAVEPRCLLLDEPLSNLDANLRNDMRREIHRICKQTGITTIYVTHDQKEALSSADRIAVLEQGRLVQVGTPVELYEAPGTAFVAEFIGRTNLIGGEVVGPGKVATAVGELAISKEAAGGSVTLSIRPERVRFVSYAVARGEEEGRRGELEARAKNRLTGRLIESSFLGESSEHVVDVSGVQLRLIAAPPRMDVKGEVAVEFDAADVVVLPGSPR
jgi:iron(III) transport system ATP-binding protein